MGIKGLFKLLEDEAKGSYKEINKEHYSSKLVAVDASILLYQFLIQIRIASGNKGYTSNLTNKDGEITSHIQGFLNRTALLLESGIRPVYVFDGIPPKLKMHELSKRRKNKEKANKDLEDSHKNLEDAENSQEEEDAIEDINTFTKRTVRVSKEQNEEVKYLLKLLGIPVINAPGEAEAQCAELTKTGVVKATATEDMDTLAFASSIVLKKLFSSKGEPVIEIDFNKVLEKLALTYDQFIDLCILSGCDYCPTIPGIGPKTALKLIRKYGNIEEIIKHSKKVPDDFLQTITEVRLLFKTPLVTPSTEVDVSFNEIKKEELIDFLVVKKGFNLERVNKVVDRIINGKKQKTQIRMDSFFKKS